MARSTLARSAYRAEQTACTAHRTLEMPISQAGLGSALQTCSCSRHCLQGDNAIRSDVATVFPKLAKVHYAKMCDGVHNLIQNILNNTLSVADFLMRSVEQSYRNLRNFVFFE